MWLIRLFGHLGLVNGLGFRKIKTISVCQLIGEY